MKNPRGSGWVGDPERNGWGWKSSIVKKECVYENPLKPKRNGWAGQHEKNGLAGNPEDARGTEAWESLKNNPNHKKFGGRCVI